MVLTLRRPAIVMAAIILAGCSVSAPRSRPSDLPPSRQPATVPPVRTARTRPPTAPEAARPRAPVQDDSGPLTAKIRDGTPANRAAALRMTEQARGLIAAGEEARAIEILERAIAIDASAPYAYYFLAMAHQRAKRPQLARPFLDRAQQKLRTEPYWLGQVHALRGQIAEEEGRPADARADYERALQAFPGNADASAGLARLGAEDAR
jgi:tetratricopeptide (TPR) repeat protein